MAEKSIFVSALERASGEERNAYLSQACAADPALRAAVEQLLAAHSQPRNLLDDPPRLHDLPAGDPPRAAALVRQAAAAQADGLPADDDRTGDCLGNYRLREKIGEGGFGQVYVADQHQPVRRRVALKLLKPGLHSREVLARFAAEQQALAMMDHPHIAQVFDAGVTQHGHPYLVMELVRGVPITDYCRGHQLNLRARLQLIIDVCQAVQHAHQKGVIHRDLKPSNVMVSLHDTKPVVKVIDFGVAKALGEPLTDITIYTRFAQMIGTPLYMSPEQAEMNGLDVDTRSDIYSLGVLLYELLTGVTPFDQGRLRTATFDELRRILREEDPPRPSVRLSTLATGSSPGEGTPREALQSQVARLRGDLDWIVMKALEKDRSRRYDSAADLARDIERHLQQQPVLARPPSAGYRFSRFWRRNKIALGSAALILIALLVGTVVSGWQAFRATQARAEADALRHEAEAFADRLKQANVLLDSARAHADQQRWPLALAQYTEATELQPDHYLTWAGRGSLYAQLGAWHAAAADFANALRLGAPANHPAWWGVPQLFVYAEQADAYRLARDRLEAQLNTSRDISFVLFATRSLLLQPTPPDQAQRLVDRLHHMPRSAVPRRPHPPDLAWARGGAPQVPLRRAPPPEPPGADRFLPPFPGPPPETVTYVHGWALCRAADFDQAVPQLKQVVEAAPHFPAGAVAWPALALAHHGAGQTHEAERALAATQQLLQEWTSALVADGPPALPVPWFDYLECLVLFREAHLTVHGTLPTPDDRLDAFEQQLLAAAARP